MDLLKLAAKIELDDQGYTSGLGKAEKAAQMAQSKISAMTVAMGNIATDLIRKGASTISNIIGGAIDGYADYQQLVGGVETLFKSSAGKVAKYAKESYKTTGLSANDYMETVTSFSASLLQGLGGNTELAADLANTAITDMADNANKMGTDIGSIQTAYQGFAKQNYTMLDNLKLGYGGTKEEMVRLINDSGILDKKIKNLDGITFDQIVQALHVVQTEMGITGTTASEAASTISGSKASLKAAWEDMLAVVGGAGDQDRLNESMENFKSSFSTYMENYIPSLVESITSSGSLVTAIGDSIASLPTTLLSDISEAGLDAGIGVVGGVSKITNWVIESITNMFKNASANPEQIADFGAAIGEFIGTAIGDIVKNAPAILQGIVDVGINLAGGLVQGLFEGLFGQDAEVDKITDALQNGLTDIDLKNAKASAILGYMDSLIEKYGEAASETEEWKEAQSELESVFPDAGEVFVDYGDDIGGAVKHLKDLNEELRRASIKQALEKAMAEENALLTTQTLEYNKAKGRRDRNAAYSDTYMDTIRAGIQEAAGSEAQRLWAESHDANGNLTNPLWSESYYQDLLNWSKGMYDFGDGLKSLEDLDFDQLESIIQNFGSDEGLLSMFETNKELYKEAQAQVTQAQADMDEAKAQMDATKTAISETKTAAVQTLSDLLGGESQAALATSEFANAVVSATKVVQGAGGGYMPEDTGLDYVPYNGFKASLHKGERIVTAGENRKMSAGSVNLEGLEDRLVAAIQAGMQNVTVRSYLNGRDITQEVNRQTIRKVQERRFRG